MYCLLYYLERLHVLLNALIDSLLLVGCELIPFDGVPHEGLSLEYVVEADLPDVVQVESQHRSVQVLQKIILLLLRGGVHFVNYNALEDR